MFNSRGDQVACILVMYGMAAYMAWRFGPEAMHHYIALATFAWCMGVKS